MNITAISPFAAVAAIVLSGLSLALMLARLGRDEFPPALFRAACALGVVMANLIIVLEAPFSLQTGVFAYSPFVTSFAFAGFPEEAVKFAAVIFFLRPHYLCRTPRALVLGGAAVGLGFALTEDFLYIVAAGAQWGVVATGRALTAVPMHVFIGAIAGFACARGWDPATPIRSTARIAPAYLAAGLLHGFYDLPQLIAKARPPYPAQVRDLAGWLGLAQPTLLNAVLLVATLCIAGTGFVLFLATDRAPIAQAAARPMAGWRGRFARVALSRAAAGIVSGLFLLGALGFVAIAAMTSFITSQGGPLVVGAFYAVFPLAIALVLLRRGRPVASAGVAELSRPFWRRPGFVVAAALVVAAVGAGYHWGGAPARNLISARIAFEGVKAAAAGDLEDAIRHYDRALLLNPENIDGLSKRSGALAVLRRYDRALADLDAALRLRPDNVVLLLQRADVHDQMHASADEQADLDRALALAPNSPEVWSSRALYEAEIGASAKADADSLHALALNPRNPQALRTQADLMIRTGDYAGAQHDLDEELRANPGDVDASFDRGRLRLYQGDATGAADDFAHANAILVTPYPALWLFLARQRAKVDGVEVLAAQTKHWPADVWPYPVIQQLLGKMSANQTRAAAADDDERCEADFYNGELLLNAGATEDAVAAFHQAIGECPSGFLEREGAGAELRRLGRPVASGEAQASPPPAPASTSEAANGAPVAAAPKPSESSEAANSPPVSAAPPPPEERKIASGVAPASITAGGVYKPANAVWSLIDRGNGVTELTAILLFTDPSLHGELALKRTVSNGDPHYDLSFKTLPDDLNSPTFSKLGVKLAEPEIEANGRRDPMVDPTSFLRVDNTTYQMPVSPSNVANALVRLAAGTKLTLQLAPSCQCVTLSFDLNAHSAPVFLAAEGAWR